MNDPADTYGALSRALSPPGGDPSALPELGLPDVAAPDLQAEHTALFGRGGEAVVSPYEGGHRTVDLHDLLDSYSQGGLAPDRGWHDRPDHVALELAFLADLTRRETAAARRGDWETAREAGRRARVFFGEHLGRWGPDFFAALARESGFPIHGSIAGRGASLLARERACFGPPSGSRGSPPATPPAAVCSRCGKAFGFAAPNSPGAAPGLTCLACRLQAERRIPR